MLKRLKLQGVGPAEAMDIDPIAPRFNLLTGDNGLGKTFLLDAVWWVLTTTWPGERAYPRQLSARTNKPATNKADPTTRPAKKSDDTPRIDAWLRPPSEDSYRVADVGIEARAHWNWTKQQWVREQTVDPYLPGTHAMGDGQRDEGDFRASALVVYARVDGGVAIWDPYQVQGGITDFADGAIAMNSTELWQGKRAVPVGRGRPPTLCRGLLEDLASWQGTDAPEFMTLSNILRHLSAPGEVLKIGDAVALQLGDKQKIPTLSTSYGDVPITLASAGIQRVLGLAYALVWAWSWHGEAAQVTNREPTRDMVILLDEIELHLHPRWQRTLPGALLHAVDVLAAEVQTQFFITTHAPMVLAAFEPGFDEAQDSLWMLDLIDGDVRLERDDWRRRGDVNRWLVSDVFDLKAATSTEAEVALERAQTLLAARSQDRDQVRQAHEELCKVLPTMDPFFVRWQYYMRDLLDDDTTPPSPKGNS